MAACLLLAVVRTADNISSKPENTTHITEPGQTEDGYHTQIAGALSPALYNTPAPTSTHTAHTRAFHTATLTQASKPGNIILPGSNDEVASGGLPHIAQANMGAPAAGGNNEITGLLPVAGSERQEAILAFSEVANHSGAEAFQSISNTMTDAMPDSAATMLGTIDALPENNDGNARQAAKKLQRNRLGIYAGAQLQGSLGAVKEVNAAPMARLQYNLGKKWYAATGLGVYTGNGGARAQEKEVEKVNDFAMNVKEYITTTSYKKLRYIDVPVLAGYKITKALSVEAGLQVGFLVSSSFEKEKLMVDFNNNGMSPSGFTPPLFFDPSAALPQAMPAKPKRTDYRFLAGVRYDMGRLSAGLQYQQGFSPVMVASSENVVNSAATKSLNLQLLYRLW